MRTARCLLWTALTCLALPARQTAHACSVSPCNTGLTLPMDGGSLPANALPLLWRRPGAGPSSMSEYELELFVRSDDTSTALEFELTERGDVTYITPRQALRPGSELNVRYTRPSCGLEPVARLNASISITESAPRPERLGKLRAREHQGLLRVASIAGDCAHETWAGYADVEVELAEDARAYRDVLRYELRIDRDAPWIYYDTLYATNFEERLWVSSLGERRDRVFVACDPDVRLALALRGGRSAPALSPGKHRVRMIGILPDDSTIESDQLEVELRCDEPESQPQRPAADGGGGCGVLRLGSSVPTGLYWLAALWIACRRRKRGDSRRDERSTP